MRIEDREVAESRAYSLVPQMALVPALPDVVCAALQRHAAATATQLPPDGAAQAPEARWVAHRRDDALDVTLTLQDGPLRSLVLRFAAQPDGNGATMLWITGEYGPRRALLRGPLGRLQARREADALREGVLAAVMQMMEQPASRSGPAARRAPRKRVRAHARLLLAGYAWTGEVLDVSDGGLAVVIACPRAHAADTAAFLIRHSAGEVEISLPGVGERLQVLVRRAQPGRGGVQVGLQVLDPEKTLPLLRRAMAQP